jgi:hypothetical protein
MTQVLLDAILPEFDRIFAHRYQTYKDVGGDLHCSHCIVLSLFNHPQKNPKSSKHGHF